MPDAIQNISTKKSGASSFKNWGNIILRLFRYNMKIIFANKFIYFLLAAVAFFLLVAILNLFSKDTIAPESVFYWLIFPGILLVFYPTTFGIQNDADARMLEILFGIPNYRYKVWLVRMAMIYLVVAAILTLLAILTSISIVAIPVGEMVFHVMFPIFFMGSLAFMLSTIITNGNGTAVAIVVIGMIIWIISASVGKWNIFLNPFQVPSNVNELAWPQMVIDNRIIQAVGTVIWLLTGLFRLQKREKFI